MIIDSHCHLDYFQENERAEIIKRAQEKGIGILHTICTKLSEADKIINIAKQHDNVYASVGIHPNEVANEQPIDTEKFITFTKQKKVISIGETGLDYHYGHDSSIIQKKSFITHMEIARATGLPLVIHSRDADEDMIMLLEQEYKKGEFKAIMHSFASSEKLCDAALALGFYISFSGIVTFKNAQSIQKIALKVPNDRLLVETDAPYLAPAPYRGQRNEPAFVQHVVEYLCSLRKCDNVGTITTDNFLNLFRISLV